MRYANGTQLVLPGRSARGSVLVVMHAVGSRELRPRFGEYLERARDGDEVVVLVHGQPAALLRPVRSNDAGALVPSRLVRDERIVAAKLAREEYLLLIASAVARAQVGVARPEGFEPPTL
jgi:prevent-host-death family protein